MNSTFSFVRLGAILNKEFIQLRRDRLTFAMMLVVPIIQLLLFGFAINSDPKRLPAALLELGRDHYSRAVVAALEETNYYRFGALPSTFAEADELLARGDVAFVVVIPSDFGARVDRADNPSVLVEADATDPAVASGALGSLASIAQNALAHEMGIDAAARTNAGAQVNFVIHRRYNPAGVSQFNVVPGLLGVILQMTAVMMTAMALTREIERGTMENLLAMPATGAEIMLGKILPFMVIGAVQVVVILSAAMGLFGVPFQGSASLLLLAILLFVLALLLLGYTFSTAARNQMQAMQLTFFFFLPSILLSGFMFPFSGMPRWAQWIGEMLPLTHFLRIVRSVMLKGGDWPAVAREMAALAIFIAVYAGLALLRFRRTLD
jgi:ABC-2 type transport system permease protein